MISGVWREGGRGGVCDVLPLFGVVSLARGAGLIVEGHRGQRDGRGALSRE